jgi:hypothetical protein
MDKTKSQIIKKYCKDNNITYLNVARLGEEHVFVQMWGYIIQAGNNSEATRIANINLLDVICDAVKEQLPSLSDCDIARISCGIHKKVKISFDTSECKSDSW